MNTDKTELSGSTNTSNEGEPTKRKRVSVASADGTRTAKLYDAPPVAGKRKRIRVSAEGSDPASIYRARIGGGSDRGGRDSLPKWTRSHSMQMEEMSSDGHSYSYHGSISHHRDFNRTDDGAARPRPHKKKQYPRTKQGQITPGMEIQPAQPGQPLKPKKKKGQGKRPARPIEPVKYEEVVDPSTEIRLNKFLANSGICSRREADELIRKGEVTVNGVIASELGCRVTRLDEVIYKGQRVQTEHKVYVLLNKPRNCVTTSDDPENRRTVMDIVSKACPERIYPVGRLDRYTTGVLLITNDGELASKLTHPSFKKKKIYHVWLDKPVTMEHMQQIADGIELEDGEIHADAISYVKEDDLCQVGIEIHSGRNRIVRRIFEYLGYKVTKLDRVYFAGLTKKNLPRGRWRYLDEQEVNNLRMGAFE